MTTYEVEIEERTVRIVRFQHPDNDLGQDDISDVAAALPEDYIRETGSLIEANWTVNSGRAVT